MVRALVLEPCPETFPGDAAAVAAGIRSRCRGAPGRPRGCPGGGVGAYWAA